ncbi:hypothetical protein [Jiangella alba]|uniref:Uncharacterized protein n=1 Tax=Jiangella alba TaxID=561176 RepID=A0A1H5PME5_9ACTN|nr:hypothetical protein [Jiangella alba]SEF14935.1 hypothetical protein SAMN04488561_4787 [Jiangella alba]
MTAEVEFGTTGDPATPSSAAPARTPAMRAYCATLARFTSSVQSTEQLLRNDDAGTREDTEQREQTAATRLRGIHRASSAADDGLAHCATVRSEYGLMPLPGHGPDQDPGPAAGPAIATDHPSTGHPHPDHVPGPTPDPSARYPHPGPGPDPAIVDPFASYPRPGPDPANPRIHHSHPAHAPGAAAPLVDPLAGDPHPGPGPDPAAADPSARYPGNAPGPGPAPADPSAGHLPTPHPDDRRSFDAAGRPSSPAAGPHHGPPDWTYDARPDIGKAGRHPVDPAFYDSPPPTGNGPSATAAAEYGLAASTAGDHSSRADTDPDHGPPTGHRPPVDDRFGVDSGYGPSADHLYAAHPAGASTAGPTGGATTAVHTEPVVRRTTRPVDDPTPALDRLRRTGGADLGVALTALGRRRDELKLAETDFETWLIAHDERSRRVTTTAVAGAGLAGASVMVVAGTRMSAAMTLVLLVVCTLAVVAVGLGVAAARRLPRVCRGAGLARRPDAAALVRCGARIGGAALLALTVANVAAGAL